jgi:hypothetical protein
MISIPNEYYQQSSIAFTFAFLSHLASVGLVSDARLVLNDWELCDQILNWKNPAKVG